MRRQAILSASLMLLSSVTLLADFSYDQTSKITGGMMAGMMKMAGTFSKAAREPMASSVYVKGDRMAHVNARRTQVIDLKAQTITEIDLDKKTYSVMTFEQMKQMMEQMSQKMADKKAENPDAQFKFKVSVKDTGVKKNVNGFDTKEAIMTLQMEGKDQKSGQTGDLSIVSDMFLAPKMSGYEEVRDFQMKMVEKLNWNPSSSGMGAALQPGAGQGMAELSKEVSKLDGIPVHQLMRMGSMDAINAAANAPPQAEGQKQGSTGQAASSAATDSAASSIADRLGKFGGLGGFGKKKKQDAEQPAESGTPQGDAQKSQAGGLLMEMTTDLSNFSSAAIDPSKFEVPAGFKQVENHLSKQK